MKNLEPAEIALRLCRVSAGVAPLDYLDQMLAEPFTSFTFSPAGAAVYRLGRFGTEAKKLKQLDLNP